VTSGSPTGPVIWQTGDPVPAAGAGAYEAYYCCYPPFPDEMDRSGSAGCSGTAQQGLAPAQDYYQGVYGGYYLNGQRC
jgi:hypothetical protein